ncbi:MinD/ParA family protein [Paenibacillus sp. GCM10023252]|uniref:MinD/ParA family protein n=1 Tax=Paenibacillus sp. GCM10023252 TaxID=3252649 RepID=UPI00360F0BD2
MSDQAEALRHLIQNRNRAADSRNTRIVTVTSGKGGVGKSNFSLAFALALSRLGQRVLVFDADIGMANIDVLMGVHARYNLYHLLKQEKTIWEIVQEGPEGLHFIAGGSGFKDLLELTPEQLDYFAKEIEKLQDRYDVILFDTGAGLSKETVKFITAAQETIVVTTPEPTSITDAYSLIKMIKNMDLDIDFKLVVNRASDDREGKHTADKISMAAERFLDTKLPILGIVPDDPLVSRSVKRQVPFIVAYPACGASKATQAIAENFLQIDRPRTGGQGVKGFIHKMLRLTR